MPDGELLRRWEAAAERIAWQRRWDAVYEPGARGGHWFPGATLNAAENCVDRHVLQQPDKIALYWEGEPRDRRAVTYRELHEEVRAFAEALRGLGVAQGDRVALHMGLIPETVVAMLACARLGAVHAVMAAALPADALADRLADLEPKILVTQDGAWRHGVILPLKAHADEAIPASAGVDHTVVVRRTGIDVAWYEGDRWYDELVAAPRPGTVAPSEPSQPFPADHPLLVSYISSWRGRPIGIVHGTGGFLTFAAALHADGFGPDRDTALWVAVEIAWLAGQSHGVYGALSCGATSVIFEGMLDTPTHARAWDVIERYRVGTLVTTPSVLHNLHRWSDSPPGHGQLESLRYVTTAGERSRPDLLEWIGAASGALVADSWGQTELGGGVVLSDSLRGVDALPRPGLDVVDAAGRSVGAGVTGELVLREPWPGTCVGLQTDDPDVLAWHWERHDGAYATGDRAMLTPDGAFVFLGRIDPMVNVSGQLVSLTEVRDALLEHPFVRDAEVVDQGGSHASHSLAAFVVLAEPTSGDGALVHALRAHVHERLGGLARPRMIAFVEDFPPELARDHLRAALRLLGGAAPRRITADQVRAVGSTAISL